MNGVRLVPLQGDFAAYRRRVIFSCCKWDPQVGDSATISDHACAMAPATRAHLFGLAEKLAGETLALERALAKRPDLLRALGLGGRMAGVLARADAAHDAHVRVMRFDFHPTADGWAVSEVNSDVPGGYAEASALPLLAASMAGGGEPPGDVAGAIVAAMRARVGEGKRIAFVHATAYADDRQVMQFLADRFAAAGFEALLMAPDHLRWVDGLAHSVADEQAGPVDGVVRFFPADWLSDTPGDWRGYFAARTPCCNPATALLSQSKRLPLVWDRLGVDAPTWRAVLPETRDPRDAPWRTDASWALKPAMGRVGEGVAWRGAADTKTWRRIARRATWRPGRWLAQRRFDSIPLEARGGARHLCVGVFTVDGRAAGMYGRLSAKPIVDQHAQDVAILMQAETVSERHVA